MTEDDRGTAEVVASVEKVVAAGNALQAGWFRFHFADQRWEWSDEVAHMHGYTPGDVTPTTELLLSHKHPDDRDRVEAALVSSVHDHAPFSSRHRIIDTHGIEHHVVVVSDSVTDDAGTVVGTEGYYIDLTDRDPAQTHAILDDLLPRILQHRVVIEQAKGALMLVYGISAEQAFRVLVWRSQETNIRLRDLAARLITEIAAIQITPATRSQFDHLLLTLHQHAPPTPVDQGPHTSKTHPGTERR
ncbi:PAS and ANTAR domain-containing protein [Nocardia sp. NPDC004151]|uniref:PAS and ANTAR domain-containing protein n=1 Tax=Nocardia sp. NPDC004151 TaxID=3364304 RepID=UPI0036AA2C4C